jgi:hypothetical protein
MLGGRRKVCEIVGSHRVGCIPIAKNSATPNDEVNLFFTIVLNWLATTTCIERNLCEASQSSGKMTFGIALAEDWSEMTG